MVLQAEQGRTPIFRMKTLASKGFTYIEVLVVLTIVLVLISVVRPNLVGLRQGQSRRQFREQLRVMAGEARLRAMNLGHTVSLSYDKSSKEFQVRDESADGTASTSQSLSRPEGVTTGKFSADKNETEGDSWRVPFFADGLSAGGGVELDVAGEPVTFLVDRNTGLGRYTNGKLEEMPPDRWKAGSYVKRT